VGTLYRAYQPSVGREVMVEVIGRAESSDADFIRHFEADAQRLSLLDHPNINPLLDYWRDTEGAFLVYRWHRGGFVHFPTSEVVRQVASALAYAHSYGLVHGSFRPDRVMLDESGNGYLFGFPIAGVEPVSSPDYSAYIAPEVLAGEPPSVATDVYALGVLAHESESGPVAGDVAVEPEPAAIRKAIAEDPGPLTVRFAETGEQRLTLAATYLERDVVGPYLVGLSTYEANVADQFDMAVFVKLADGVDLAAGTAAVTALAEDHPRAAVLDRSAFEDTIGAEIDSILNLIYVLLGLAVLIALLGIANTLALSIFERTPELGLLRAVGMTRAQVRAAVRWESVIIALLGTALGLAIGTSFSWVMAQALAGQGLSTYVVPVGQLGVIVAIAAASGVAAAILPARRAARLDVLDAISAV
jgi:hypothetical protein